MRLSKFELIILLLLIIVPFFLVIVILQPFTEGIHGTTYASSENIFEFDGEVTGDDPHGFEYSREGHFQGDIYIQDGTGWILCNGKVRYSGEIHINNADCDYEISSEEHSGSFFAVDYQDITLDGDEGEMEEGFPYYFLGFIGSAAGFVFWMTYIITKRNMRVEKGIYIIFSSLVLIGIAGLLFSYCILPIVLAILLFLLFLDIYGVLYPSPSVQYIPRSKRYFLPLPFSKFNCALLLMFFGLIISYASIYFFAFTPTFSSSYSHTTGMAYFYCGMIGIISSPGLIGFGIGKLPSGNIRSFKPLMLFLGL